MCRKVPPLQVSPFIKAARWTFLICGIMYGVFKLHSYRIIDSKVRPLRMKAYEKYKEKMLEDNRNSSRKDIMNIAEELDIKELPPGWDESL